MNDQNQFPSHGFAAYDRPNRTPRRKGIAEKIFGPSIGAKFRNPLFATTALLLTGAAFAAIVVISYPDAEKAEDNVPIILSETGLYKATPDAPGGMDVPFQDSTIFMSMQDGELKETAPVENLLAEEEPVDRFALLEAQDEAANAADAEPASGTEDEAVIEDTTNTITDETPDAAVAQVAAEAAAEEEAPFAIRKIEQSVEKIPPQDLAAAAATQDKPKEIHPAGSSPETLAFVRSVLDHKDTKPAEQASAVEPASGAAANIGAIEPGGYFVQLASVTSEAGATSEWSKMQKSYGGLLENISYRVQRADLDRGTFYRIQAGPMSKDSADSLCDAIKAQKPGGCLVVR